MPARISALPTICRGPSTSPMSRKLKRPAKTGSAAKIRAVWVGRGLLGAALDEKGQGRGKQAGKGGREPDVAGRPADGPLHSERSQAAEHGHRGDLHKGQAHRRPARRKAAHQQDVRGKGDGAAHTSRSPRLTDRSGCRLSSPSPTVASPTPAMALRRAAGAKRSPAPAAPGPPTGR